MSAAIYGIEQGRPDYSGWRARHDQWRGQPTLVKPEVAIARSVIESPHIPIDPDKAGKISVRPIPGNEHPWWLVDAVRASVLSRFDSRRIDPAQIGRLVDKIGEYGAILAQGGSLPAGVTTLPDTPDLPTTYRVQQKGTGTDQDLTAFDARFDISNPTDPSERATALVIHTVSRNDEIRRTLERFETLGYGRRDKAIGKKTNNARG